MATAKAKEEELVIDDPITTVEVKKEENQKWPMVRVFIPAPENADEGSKVDMYEHVSIANEVNGQKIWYVLRGEWTEVPVPVFVALKEKYPKL